MDKSYITMDSDERKRIPLARGLLDYFPAACAEVAKHSLMADEKHNGPQPPEGRDPRWKRGASSDHADCIMRHLVNRGGYDGQYRESTALAWRAMALLQEEMEAEGAKPGRASLYAPTNVYVTRVILCGDDPIDSPKVIQSIKSMREMIPALGLKEAKDIVEGIVSGSPYVLPHNDPESAAAVMFDFLSRGFLAEIR